MSSSENKIICNSKNLIICFGGMALQMGGILPFEFLNYLSKIYINKADLYFYIDKNQCWYHKGIDKITKNVDETVLYLNNIIKKGNFDKVIFMGVSSGGYGAILFGSLCNVHNVISYIPRTNYHPKMIDDKYYNLKTVINPTTKYILYGDLNFKDINNNHHISQCNNLKKFNNVEIIELKNVNMKELKYNGTIKNTINNILNMK